VHVAAKTDEIVTSLQVLLPTTIAAIVAEEVVAAESFGKLGIVSVVGSGMADHWGVAGPTRRRLGHRRRRNEAAGIGPIRGQALPPGGSKLWLYGAASRGALILHRFDFAVAMSAS
jgi:hypothetical protein